MFKGHFKSYLPVWNIYTSNAKFHTFCISISVLRHSWSTKHHRKWSFINVDSCWGTVLTATLTSEYFPLYFPRLLSTLSIRCNSCSLEKDSAFPGGSSASLSISEGGSYVEPPMASFSPKGVRDSRDELRTRLSLEGERKRFSARLVPTRIKDSIEGTFSCSFWANDCGSSLYWKVQESALFIWSQQRIRNCILKIIWRFKRR